MPEAAALRFPLSNQIAGASPRRRFVLAAIAGALAGTGQAPVSLAFTTVLGLGLAFSILASSQSPRAAFGTGWATGTAYFAVTMFWIVEPFLVDVARHGWMAPFALVFLAGGLALFWALAFAVARWLGHSGWPLAVAWALALTGAELLRGHILTGFPWALPGYAWVETGAIHWTQLIGSYGLTLVTLALSAILGLLVAHEAWRAATLGFASACLGLVICGAALKSPAPSLDNRPIVRLVQPNAPQEDKWEPDKARLFFQRQVDLTGAPTDARPDLTVWPESAVPTFLGNAGPAFEVVAAAARDTPVVLGIQRLSDGRYFNSLAVVGEGGVVTDVYDKHHLVPFGEYIPARNIAMNLGIQGLAARSAGGYSRGPGPRTMDFGALGTALPLICYEAIFPKNILDAPKRPDFLLQITNDAWFGKLSGPYQHLAQARVRAIETALPLVRVANTGISTVIDAQGQSLGEIPLGEYGFLDLPLPAPGEPTLYSRTGDAPLIWLVGLGLLAFLIARPGEKSD